MTDDQRDAPATHETISRMETALAAATAERDEHIRSHAFMVKQFEIMQREKEHGWREAETWETRAETAEAERDAALAKLAAVLADPGLAPGMRSEVEIQGRHDHFLREVSRAMDEDRLDYRQLTTLDELCWILGHPYCVNP